MIQNITDVQNIKGKRVLLRLDFNVPISGGQITDDFRIQSAIPTINLLRDAGSKVIIVSHIEGKAGEKVKKAANGGKSKTGEKAKTSAKAATENTNTLQPIADYLINKKIPVTFVPKYFTVATQKVLDTMKEGDVVLFENVRMNKGETENSEVFAKKLASMADIYVNEAFPVSHRAHASIVGVPKFLPHYAGPLFMREIKNLSQAFQPEKPFLFVLGGAKFDTKMPLIQKFLKLADFVFVGGALANNFFKELNFEVGESTVSDGDFDLPALLDTKKVFIPTDVIAVSDAQSEGGQKGGSKSTLNGGLIVKNGLVQKTKSAQKVAPGEKILDVGPQSLVQLSDLVGRSKFVLWNGPLGNYEEGFSDSTKRLAEILSRANAKSVVGGGDTVAAIRTLGLMNKFSFVSTGGGAMLDFLANETLPGIQALE